MPVTVPARYAMLQWPRQSSAGLAGHAHIGIHRNAHAHLSHCQREHRTHDKRQRPPNANDQFDRCLVGWRKVLQRFFRRRDDIHTQEQRHSKHRNEGQNAARLFVQISKCAGLDGIPHLQHFGSAHVLAKHLCPQEQRIQQTDDGDGHDGPNHGLLKRIEILHVG